MQIKPRPAFRSGLGSFALPGPVVADRPHLARKDERYARSLSATIPAGVKPRF
jgi:hypothetical protein